LVNLSTIQYSALEHDRFTNGSI